MPAEVVNSPLGDFVVELEGIFSGSISKIKIEGEVYNLAVEERISAAKGTVWVESIKTFGGSCKVEED